MDDGVGVVGCRGVGGRGGALEDAVKSVVGGEGEDEGDMEDLCGLDTGVCVSCYCYLFCGNGSYGVNGLHGRVDPLGHRPLLRRDQNVFLPFHSRSRLLL